MKLLFSFTLVAAVLLSACSLAADVTPAPDAPVSSITTASEAEDATQPTAAPLPTTSGSTTSIPLPTRATEVAEQLGVVTGHVQNGTPGGTVPGGLQVSLHSFDTLDAISLITSTVDALGGFRFDRIAYTPDRQFLVTVTYLDVMYASEALPFTPGQPALDLPVRVYETTPKSEAIRIMNWHVFFDFQPGAVDVGEVYIFASLSDRTFWKPDGTLEFSLPAEATDLQVRGLEEGSGYTRTPTGFVAVTPVTPGDQSAQMVFTYRLPYTDRLTFDRRAVYPVEMATVLLPEGNVKLSGGLQAEGQQAMQNTTYELFSSDAIAAGDSLSFELSGRPGAGSTTTAGSSSLTTILIGGGVLGLALAGVGLWWYRRARGGPAALPQDREELLQAIADLDDDFESDQVDEQDYEQRRARLKARLVKLVQDD